LKSNLFLIEKRCNKRGNIPRDFIFVSTSARLSRRLSSIRLCEEYCGPVTAINQFKYCVKNNLRYRMQCVVWYYLLYTV